MADNKKFDTMVDFGPFLFNKRRLSNAALAGLVGGTGIGAIVSLMRYIHGLRKEKLTRESDDSTIVIDLPQTTEKAGACAYDSMRAAESGETKLTAHGGTQLREKGKYGKSVASDQDNPCDLDKEADDKVPNPGPNSIGTIMADAVAVSALGGLSYYMINSLFDKIQERRLKNRLEAARVAYLNTMNGVSKSAQAIEAVFSSAEEKISPGIGKQAEPGGRTVPQWQYWLGKLVPEGVKDGYRYPIAFYLLSVLAGTGATAFITKKFLDREFPDAKLRKDVNRPTRIVFRSSPEPTLLEGEEGQEKKASDETCAALYAALPVYMDAVEGIPSRTKAEPYVKFAESLGTDPKGLMKMATVNMTRLVMGLLSNPYALYDILTKTRFGLDASVNNVRNILRRDHNDLYKNLVRDQINSRHGGTGLWDNIKRYTANKINDNGGTDYLIDHRDASTGHIIGDGIEYGARKIDSRLKYVPFYESSFRPLAKGGYHLGRYVLNKFSSVKEAMPGTLSGLKDVVSALEKGKGKPEQSDESETDPVSDPELRKLLPSIRSMVKSRGKIRVEASDPKAIAYLKKNQDRIRRIVARLGANGVI